MYHSFILFMEHFTTILHILSMLILVNCAFWDDSGTSNWKVIFSWQFFDVNVYLRLLEIVHFVTWLVLRFICFCILTANHYATLFVD